jgi:hypothetical protein
MIKVPELVPDKSTMKNLTLKITCLTVLTLVAFSASAAECRKVYENRYNKKRDSWNSGGVVGRFFSGVEAGLASKGFTTTQTGSSTPYSSKIGKSLALLHSNIGRDENSYASHQENSKIAFKKFNKAYKKAVKINKNLKRSEFQQYIKQGFDSGDFCVEDKFLGPNKILKYALALVEDNFVADSDPKVTDDSKQIGKESSESEGSAELSIETISK